MAETVTIQRNSALDAALSDEAVGRTASDLDKSIADVSKAAEEHSKRGTELAQDISKKRTELGELKPPSVPNIPDVPQAQYRQPMEGFGSAAGLVATFGSLLTRRPLVNALNASAGVMNAYRAQDEKAYQDAIQTWKMNFEKAVKLHDWQNDLYKEIVGKIEGDSKLAQAEFEAYGAALGDQQIVMLAREKKFDDIVKLLEFRENKMTQAQNHADMIDQREQDRRERQREFDQRQRELKSVTEAGWQILTDPNNKDASGNSIQYRYNVRTGESTTLDNKPYTPGGAQKIGTGSQGAPLTDAALKLAGTEYRVTGRMPALGLGSAGARTSIINEAARQAQEIGQSPEEIVALQAGTTSDTASLRNITRIADSAQAYEDTAIRNIGIVKEKMPKGVGFSGAPIFDRWVQSGRIAFGDADVPPYATSLVTVANEYAKVMSGSTGAQGSTVDSRREAAELLNSALNTDQVLGVLDIMVRDMENKKAAYREQRAIIGDRIKAAGTGTPAGRTNDPLGIR